MMDLKRAKDILSKLRPGLEARLRTLPEYQNHASDLFSVNWLEFEIGHRSPPTFATSLANYGVDDPARSRGARRAEAEERERDPEDHDETEEIVVSPEEQADTPQWSFARSAHDLHLESYDTPGPLACARGIGDADLIVLFLAVAKDDSVGSDLVHLLLSTLTGFDQLSHSRMEFVCGQAFALQRVTSPHEPPRRDEAHFYRAAGNDLYHRLDQRAQRTFQRFFGDPIECKRRAEEYISAHVPRGTCAKLYRALAQLGPSVCKYSWIYAHYAYEGNNPHTRAQKHYCVIDAACYRSVFAYQAKYLGYAADHEIADSLPACGAMLVPQDTVIRELFALLPPLLREIESRPFQLTELGRYRLLASLVHLLFLLLTGLRNRPMTPVPWAMTMGNGWEIYLEKQGVPRPVRIFPQLGRLLARVAIVTRHVTEAISGRVDGAVPTGCYLFPYLTRSGTVVIEFPRHAVVRDGLAGESESRGYSDLARTAVRSWANTILREKGSWSELDVRRMFTHHSRHQGPMSRSRMEASWDESTNWEICEALAEEAGIWPWLSQI